MHVDVTMALLRLVHIFAATFWVGIVWYLVLFGHARVESNVPENGRWLEASPARLFPFMNVAAVSTTISGALMYWEISSELSRSWIATPRGMVLGIAGVLGALAIPDGFAGSRARPVHVRRSALLVTLALAGMAVARVL